MGQHCPTLVPGNSASAGAGTVPPPSFVRVCVTMKVSRNSPQTGHEVVSFPHQESGIPASLDRFVPATAALVLVVDLWAHARSAPHPPPHDSTETNVP